MPNGGVPRHMVLYPEQGDLVLYCRGGELSIFQKEDWTRNKSKAEPLATFSKLEGSALAWFLRYWIGEVNLKPGYDMPRDVRAEFDF